MSLEPPVGKRFVSHPRLPLPSRNSAQCCAGRTQFEAVIRADASSASGRS
jgi:hypothetical protein